MKGILQITPCCATRLYDAGIPEQVIQETTGHRSSDGVKAYKCTSSSLKRKASEILQGTLPKISTESNKAKYLKENSKEEECVSNQLIVINTDCSKIVVSYK